MAGVTYHIYEISWGYPSLFPLYKIQIALISTLFYQIFFKAFWIKVFFSDQINGDIMNEQIPSSGYTMLALYLDKNTFGRGCHIDYFIYHYTKEEERVSVCV